ncbi:MAG: hypothetical protein RL685_4576 [Pseudomonadota bacterium]|jgi:hypothetical protein
MPLLQMQGSVAEVHLDYVTSTEAEGTTFAVRLPRHLEQCADAPQSMMTAFPRP